MRVEKPTLIAPGNESWAEQQRESGASSLEGPRTNRTAPSVRSSDLVGRPHLLLLVAETDLPACQFGNEPDI